jgi:LPS export ABC transporter permease LptF/LPS export ABC transporter permease LptG
MFHLRGVCCPRGHARLKLDAPLVRILTRYILKEVLTHAALGTLLFTFVIFMRDLGRLLELVVRNSAPLPSLAEIFFLTLPTALTLTLPMGVLVGILIGLSRMSADSEVVAMRASGLGASSIVASVSLFVVAAWLLALGNSLVVAPRSAAALVDLQDSLKGSQASLAVQPRVFYENFKDRVLYVQDAISGPGAAVWKNVFLADVSNPSAPKIVVAERAIVATDEHGGIRFHLSNGSQHETLPKAPDLYNLSTFAESDLPLQSPAPVDDKRDPPAAELRTAELLQRARDGEPSRARWYLIEFHRRLALPTSCLVLALVGIPLGLASRKGGKASGFVLTVVLVFAYYMVSLSGVAMARQGRVSPAAGVWFANALFLLAGLFLLRRVDHAPMEATLLRTLLTRVSHLFSPKGGMRATRFAERAAEFGLLRPSGSTSRFPLLVDNYVLSSFVSYLALVLASFLLLLLVFTFFELLNDIIRNRIALVTVGEYLLNVTPYMIYQMTPISVLIAALVTLTLLERSNELTAMKATGISLYRAVAPILAAALVVSAGLFLFEQFYLPDANTRQEALRNTIKGKPPQTFLRPDRKWIVGQPNVIYYYEHFDPDQNSFAGFSVFIADPATYEIQQRIYAARARWNENVSKWVLEQGWYRSFSAGAVSQYHTFEVSTFDQISEPPSYFKKEVRLSQEMNYGELSRYIGDLQQSGFDTVRLRVQLHKKLAFPAIGFVMAILAVPFSLQAGRRGALTGVGLALGIAIVYWMTSGFFEALGNVNQLPAPLAAWAPDLLFGLAGGYLLLKVRT